MSVEIEKVTETNTQEERPNSNKRVAVINFFCKYVVTIVVTIIVSILSLLVFYSIILYTTKVTVAKPKAPYEELSK